MKKQMILKLAKEVCKMTLENIIGSERSVKKKKAQKKIVKEKWLAKLKKLSDNLKQFQQQNK